MAIKIVYYILALSALLYFCISFVVFNKVFETSKLVIDELFHLPQGLQYCQNNFSYWDHKITTLPGLYIVSKILSLLFFDCSVYILRFTNLLASLINFHLLVLIIEKQNNLQNNLNLKCIVQALNLSILPPLYFFSHLYYTDTLSLTFILLFINFTYSKRYFYSTIFGAGSILMRQTNVVWIAFYLGRKLSDSLYRSYIKSIKGKDLSKKSKNTVKEKSTRIYTVMDVFDTLIYHLKTCFVSFFKTTSFNDFMAIFSNILLLFGFVIFVYINGSIVVGDKTAHSASLHIPQLFYFTVFYAVFTLPLLLSNGTRDINKILSSKRLTIFLCAIFLIAVHFNTIVHPYMLADNRHYTFYVWNRFYGKYWFARYTIVPLYVYVFYSISNNVRSLGAGFILPYLVCLFASLALQKMLEIRYFLIPYIILRISSDVPSSWKVILCESLIYLAINIVAFRIFFTKEIHWSDFDDVQRLIW